MSGLAKRLTPASWKVPIGRFAKWGAQLSLCTPCAPILAEETNRLDLRDLVDHAAAFLIDGQFKPVANLIDHSAIA